MGLGVLQEDREILRELTKKSKDPRERERLRALCILSLGETVERVMAFFIVDESTVYRWIERWQHERNLHDKPWDGRLPAIGSMEKKEIKKLIQEKRSEEPWTQHELLGYQGTADLFRYEGTALFPGIPPHCSAQDWCTVC